ncbi:MAG: helix-turn-helix transcriptional regulator [Oscillospiraceae bacterium]
MDFIQKIEKLLSNQKSTVNSMCKELQLGKNSMINWKERGNLPNGDTIVKLAHYFNVSADYLLGIAPPTVFEKTLSADEQELVEIYSALDNRGKARVLTVAYEEQERHATQQTLKQDA